MPDRRPATWALLERDLGLGALEAGGALRREVSVAARISLDPASPRLPARAAAPRSGSDLPYSTEAGARAASKATGRRRRTCRLRPPAASRCVFGAPVAAMEGDDEVVSGAGGRDVQQPRRSCRPSARRSGAASSKSLVWTALVSSRRTRQAGPRAAGRRCGLPRLRGHPGEHHHGELEPLGAVDRHDPHRVDVGLG